MYRLLVLLSVICVAFSAHAQPLTPQIKTSDVTDSRLANVEKKARAAAVKVIDNHERGHGSGTVIIYKDIQLVITANHVTPKKVGKSAGRT